MYHCSVAAHLVHYAMFVRWQRVGGLLRAVLCENKRVDGQPRQRHIAYLGSIEKYWLPSYFEDMSPDEAAARKAEAGDWDSKSMHNRHYFWENVVEKIDVVPSDQREKIETALATAVPRPSPEEVELVEKRNKERREHLSAQIQALRQKR